jgi:biopolymer transport protein ExbD
MARKRKQRSREKTGDQEAEMPMTPMIDVVFQLLIFFIVTLRPIDVIGHLDVFRPAPDPNARPEEQIEDMVRITVLKNHRFMLNQMRTRLDVMEQNLRKIASRSSRQTILIQCAEASSHYSLVAVLDLCAKVGLVNLSVVTLPPARGSS